MSPAPRPWQSGTTTSTPVIWPENSSDIDPLRNDDAKEQVQRALAAVDIPIIIGAILDEPAPAVSNASLLYEPGGGEPQRYVKQHPVPFAEYVPNREFYRLFSSKVDWCGSGSPRATATSPSRCRAERVTSPQYRRSASRWPTTA
uniref:Uncharacterized protein n=1 Tax=Janibacter limosus TaxID=53458 RepID=A0AC61U872_9MICO|nr:hypothetical protein [Janibacter limosus]